MLGVVTGRAQQSLRSLLTGLLQKRREPVPARDLAAQVLATGYKTKCKEYTDVVWTALGQTKEAENVNGQAGASRRPRRWRHW